MTYYTGAVTAVPTARKQEYLDHVRRAWDDIVTRGAVRMVETWGEDVQPGKRTDFIRAVQAKDDETVAFSWVEWADRATADAAWAAVMADPDIMTKIGEPPFDGKRMIFGGFQPLVTEGTDRGGNYVQGFLLSVPDGNKAAFKDMAEMAFREMFQGLGALGNYENWGDDVPTGKLTDMHRAVDAEPGETIVMSWVNWPDRATCDAAAKKMEADMDGQEMPEMPFDGKRMIWGGFSVLFDSDTAGASAGAGA